MTRTIILLSPVFVSLFWSLVLIGNKKKHTVPRLFLSKFMIFPLMCFICHFLYFQPLPEIYPYFDYAHQYAGSLILPVYYIYFRLLTVDEKFSFKFHSRYLIFPALLATIYCIGAMVTPQIEYRTWLFNEQAFPVSHFIQFLNIMRMILRLQFLLFVILTVIGNQILLYKYRERAEQFYSDINDGKYNNGKMLNYSIVILCGTSFLAVAVGRRLLMPKETIIYNVWSISTVMMYIIGHMGFKQKPINPTFDTLKIASSTSQPDGFLMLSQNKIIQNLIVQFDEKKIYLNSQLNIMDVVQKTGTNRTYLSVIINQKYNQNFCSFVNGYRIEELKRMVLANCELTNQTLTENCGFGSVISLRRAVSSSTGLKLSDWMSQIKSVQYDSV